ncbi:MAG: hypothetical protein K0R45_315 [Pseudomonas sp.]|nr:hypothetical protein [Pseudomonas sp.]
METGMKPAIMLFAACAVLSFQAHAASPDAWRELDKAMTAGCLKASQLKDTKVAGTAARFDDRAGYDALLLRGRYPQKHMKNQPGTELCLYDRKNRQAYVTEWDSINAAAR